MSTHGAENSDRRGRVAELRRRRPRSRLLEWSLWILGIAVLFAWCSGRLEVSDFLGERRLLNLRRFLTRDVIPTDLRGDAFSLGGLGAWIGEVWNDKGAAATWASLRQATLGIALAGALAMGLAPLGTRTWMRRDPFSPGGTGGGGWAAMVCAAVRVLCILMRSVPEYLVAFLLLAVLGTDAWPLVLALGIHNAGILGRLGAESLENLDRAPLRAQRMMGASRGQIYVGAALPTVLPRFLLYFFYRFETCVREATILGLLGVASLGYYVHEARAKGDTARLLLFIAFGAGLVLLADLVSQWVRSYLRRAR